MHPPGSTDLACMTLLTALWHTDGLPSDGVGGVFTRSSRSFDDGDSQAFISAEQLGTGVSEDGKT